MKCELITFQHNWIFLIKYAKLKMLSLSKSLGLSIYLWLGSENLLRITNLNCGSNLNVIAIVQSVSSNRKTQTQRMHQRRRFQSNLINANASRGWSLIIYSLCFRLRSNCKSSSQLRWRLGCRTITQFPSNPSDDNLVIV